jgi:uncharacterized membrane protein
MFTSKRWMMVAAVGQGVLFALALTGCVRIAFRLFGTPLPNNVAGNLFLLTSLVAGSLSAYLYARSSKPAQAEATASATLGDLK